MNAYRLILGTMGLKSQGIAHCGAALSERDTSAARFRTTLKVKTH